MPGRNYGITELCHKTRWLSRGGSGHFHEIPGCHRPSAHRQGVKVPCRPAQGACSGLQGKRDVGRRLSRSFRESRYPLPASNVHPGYSRRARIPPTQSPQAVGMGLCGPIASPQHCLTAPAAFFAHRGLGPSPSRRPAPPAKGQREIIGNPSHIGSRRCSCTWKAWGGSGREQRTALSLKANEPPRTTRYVPDAGPFGFRCGARV